MCEAARSLCFRFQGYARLALAPSQPHDNFLRIIWKQFLPPCDLSGVLRMWLAANSLIFRCPCISERRGENHDLYCN